MTRILAAGLVMLVILGSVSWAQDKKAADKEQPASRQNDAKSDAKPKTEAKADSKEKPSGQSGGMDDWMKLAAPGEHHKKLDALVGTWNLAISYPGEGLPTSTGKSEFKWILDGRFLQETTQSDMSGQPFNWMGWHGYDNQAKKYVSAWIDNFRTGIDTMTGQFDDANKTLTYIGETDNPEMGGKVKVRWIMRLESKDRFTVEMYEGQGNGKDRKVMEVVGTRG